MVRVLLVLSKLIFPFLLLIKLTGCGNEISETTFPPRNAAGLKVANCANSVTLYWDIIDGATSYNIYSSTESGGDYILVGSTVTASYTLTELSGGTNYYFIIKPINESGEGTQSNEISISSALSHQDKSSDVNTSNSTIADSSQDPVQNSNIINIDVWSYGAGRGDSDDTEKIKSVLSSLKAEGGGIAYFPKGTYPVKGDIQLPSNTTLLLDKEARIILSEDSGASFIFGGDNVSGVRIEGGIFDGRKAKQKNEVLASILGWNGSKDWIIKDVHIADSSYFGIFFIGGSDFAIKNTLVERSHRIGIAFYYNEDNISIENSTITESSFIGVEIAGKNRWINDIKISDVTIENSNNSNLAISYVKGGTVSNGKFNNSKTQFGLLCDHCEEIEITDSEFKGNVAGALLNYSSNRNLVRNNVFEGNKEDGIDIAYGGGKENKIFSNIMRDNGIWGVYLLEADDNVIEMNTIATNGSLSDQYKTFGAGVVLGNSNSNTIRLNTFIDCAGVQEYQVFQGTNADNNLIN